MRTAAYQFTIQSLDDKKLQKLRKKITKINTFSRKQKQLLENHGQYFTYKVEVKARFGKNNPNLDYYKNGGSANYQSCRLEHGQYFDVYLRVIHGCH